MPDTVSCRDEVKYTASQLNSARQQVSLTGYFNIHNCFIKNLAINLAIYGILIHFEIFEFKSFHLKKALPYFNTCFSKAFVA